MLDRVDDETGRLGPPEDSDVMAANIVDVWRSDRAAMGEAARAHVEESRFSWDRSFQTLFGEVYPRAIRARRSALSDLGTAAVARSTAA
jgi:alpha-1,6-mannosyltransferase